jgi:hypothetical protein
MPRAFGRNLSDFFNPGTVALPRAEQGLREAAARGVQYRGALTAAQRGAALGDPEQPRGSPPGAEGAVVRADFVRFLLLGGDDDAPVHENGVQMANGWVSGVLDLNECRAIRSLVLQDCVLDSGVLLTDSSLVNLALFGCTVRRLTIPQWNDIAIFGERMKTDGAVFIRRGCRVLGELRMQAADIGGDLDLAGTQFVAAVRIAIDLTAARIGGDLELSSYYRGGLPRRRHSIAVPLADAYLRRLGVLAQPTQPAPDPPEILDCFIARGRVILDNATVEVRLRLIGASIFFHDHDVGAGPRAALSCVGVVVKGGFFFHDVRADPNTADRRGIEGVSLLGAKVGTLVDDPESWQSGRGRHRFDGFVYDRIADESRRDDRRAWLETQRPVDLGEGPEPRIGGLREQPWEQAATALEASGELEAARDVRIAQQRLKTKSGDLPRKVWALPWDFVSRYGLDKGRLTLITLLIWFVATLDCRYLAERGGIHATDEKSLPPRYEACFSDPKATGEFLGWPMAYCSKFKYVDPKHGDYTPFYPLLYSVDNLVPVIDLGQKKAWTWDPRIGVAWFLMFEYLWGAVIGSALAALLGSYLLRRSN